MYVIKKLEKSVTFLFWMCSIPILDFWMCNFPILDKMSVTTVKSLNSDKSGLSKEQEAEQER